MHSLPRGSRCPIPSLAAGGPGRANNGNFVLSNGIRLSAAPPGGSWPAAKKIALTGGLADFSQEGLAVAGAPSMRTRKSGWAVMPQFGKPHMAIFETSEAVGAAGGSVPVDCLGAALWAAQHTLGRFPAIGDHGPHRR